MAAPAALKLDPDASAPDESLLEELVESVGEATFGAIIDAFEQDLSANLALLRRSLALNEATDARRAAHKLGGQFAQLALPRMGEAFRAIESDPAIASDAATMDAVENAAVEGVRSIRRWRA